MNDVKEELTTSEIVRNSMREYGFYVLEDRALPDIRDGLKPVQRRILWALQSLRRGSTAIPIKCATAVGEVIGKYHPHGDSSTYDTLVNLSWLRYPLVEQHGNFGSKTSLVETGYAAHRYTETRLSKLGDRMMDDIALTPMDKSFTEEHEEPRLLLTRIPLLLVNGTQGVAVGLSTCIPPHNLTESIDAIRFLIDNPECSAQDLTGFIKGPDYGTGALTSKKSDIVTLYENGKGRLDYTCVYSFEEISTTKRRLVITSLAPGFKKGKFLEATRKLAEQKLLISPANDEGSLERGTRITVDFTDQNIIKDRVVPLLKTSVNYQFYALGGNKIPKLYTLKRMLEVFVSFRRRVEQMVLKNELAENGKKRDSEDAKLKAIDNIDVVKEVLTSAESAEDAVALLVDKIPKLTVGQAEIILNTQLRTLLKKANRSKLIDAIAVLDSSKEEINKKLLNIDEVVIARLEEMRAYADKRGTKLRFGGKEVDIEESALYYVGVTAQSKLDSFTEPPTSSKAAWNYVSLVATPGSFVVGTEENVGQLVSLSFLDKFSDKMGAVIGMVSEEDSIVVAITENGKYVAFPPKQRRNKFPLFKDTAGSNIRWLVGMRDGDTLVSVFEDGEIIERGDLQVTRPNVASKTVRPRSSSNIVGVFVNKENHFFVNSNGTEIGVSELGTYDTVFQIGPKNLVVLEDGKRAFQESDAAYDAIKKLGSSVKAIVPFR